MHRSEKTTRERSRHVFGAVDLRSVALEATRKPVRTTYKLGSAMQSHGGVGDRIRASGMQRPARTHPVMLAESVENGCEVHVFGHRQDHQSMFTAIT